MLRANHIDDYIITDDADIILDAKGHRRLKEQFVDKTGLRLNLKQGYQGEGNTTPMHCKSLDVFLKYLMVKSLNDSRTLKEVIQGAEFVCRRGVLERVGTADERNKLGQENDWTMICERWNDTIFMEQEVTEDDEKKNEDMDDWQKLCTYMGKRFEQYMVQNGQYNNDYDLRMVMVSTVSDNASENAVKVMYSGEIDATDSDGKFVEFKTQKGAFGTNWYWQHKSLHWWMQSKLLDVDYIVVGIRDGTIVRETKKVELTDLESNKWSPSGCLSYLHKFLAHMKDWLGNNSACRVTFRDGNLQYEPISCEEAAVVPEYFKKHFMDRVNNN